MTGDTGAPPFDSDDSTGPPGLPSGRSQSRLHYRLTKRDGELQLAADMPGSRWGDVQIRLLDEGFLEITAQSDTTFIDERIPVPVNAPEIPDEDGIDHTFNNGVLVVTLDLDN